MPSDPKKFIITCSPRTGSTMLRVMLNTHPDIVCYGEAISNRNAPNLGRDYQKKFSKTSEELAGILATDPVGFLYQYVWERKDCKALGIKIKYRQLEEQFPALLQAIRNDPEILIIHLTRQNRLKRYVSNRLVNAAKTPTVIVKTAAMASEISKTQVKTVIDPQKCIEDMKRNRAAEKRFKAYFQGRPVFDIVYESLISPEDQGMMKLQTFLGVDPIALEPKTVKINSDSLEDLVENFDELETAIQKTSFSSYLR
jgi:LPS sulfotransferase NodH